MKDWFKKWFSSDEYLSVYAHRNEDDAENILNLILDSIPQNKKLRILDAACGAGRHSIILAEKGYNITAFDLSKILLKIGSANAKELNVDVKFLCSDIRYVTFKRAFDLVLNMFTSFGYFENDEENFRFYRHAKEFLRKDGIIVLDYLNAAFLRENIIPYSEKIIDNKLIKESRVIENNRIIKKIIIETEESTHSFFEAVKLYSNDQIIREFEQLGYKLYKTYGDYLGNSYIPATSERLIHFFKL